MMTNDNEHQDNDDTTSDDHQPQTQPLEESREVADAS